MNIPLPTEPEYIGEGFSYKVFRDGESVRKIARDEKPKDLKNEKGALEIHKKYLGTFVPNTAFIKHPDGSYHIEQDYIKGSPVDLADTTNNKVFELLNAGATMQEKEGILFDVFGLEGMVRLFNYYYGDTLLGKINNKFLPIHGRLLQLLHNFPYEKLKKLNNDTSSSPFISENIIETDDGEITFVDIEHRNLEATADPSDIKKYPLNKLGAWITKKALSDIQKMKENKTTIRV